MNSFNQKGGVYWDFISEKNDTNGRIFNLSPTENFIRTIYWYNYMLHAERVLDYDSLNSPLREYINDFIPELNNPDVPIFLFKQTLPIEYNEMMENVVFKRNILNPFDGTIDKIASFKSAMVHDPKADMLELYQNNVEVKSNYSILNKFNKQVYQEFLTDSLTGDKRFDMFNQNIKKLLLNNTIIPSVNVNDMSYWLTKDSDSYIKDLQENDYPHSRYGDFMSLNLEEEDSLPAIKPKLLNLIDYGTPLYWIDLYKIRFKHTRVENEGKVSSAKGYSIIDNITRIKNDPDFFTKLMLKTSFSKDEKSITPLTVFLMDDMLYSHDHKRIVANIAAGNRYMLGVLNQNAYVIVQREIGYRPMKCVFSQNDKSLILKFTDEQLKEFGHYFFSR